jgi:hypothetical protein
LLLPVYAPPDDPTVWVIDDDAADAAYVPVLPKYWAVIVCEPVAVYVTTHVAVSVGVPVRACALHAAIAVPPSKNFTLPVGLPELGEVAVTVAV